MIAIRIDSRALLALPIVALLGGCGGKGTTVAITATSPAPGLEDNRVYRVPSRSMEPALRIGARVEAVPGQPRIGDIVILHPPVGAQQEVCGSEVRVERGGAACSVSVPRESRIRFVKRIVAGPGDVISVVQGHVIRNGKREGELYIRACGDAFECNLPVPIKIPVGEWYLMGDNRGLSDDSRLWGPVPRSWVIGIAKPARPPGSPA